MWIEERTTKKGKVYIYNERYTMPNSATKKRVSVTLASNGVQARRKARELLDGKIQLAIANMGTLTLRQAFREFIVYKSGSVKLKTIMRYKQIARIMEGHIAHCRLQDLRTSTLQGFIGYLLNRRGIHPNTCKQYYLTIKSVLRYAWRLGYIDNIEFADKVEILNRPLTLEELRKKQNKFLERDELKIVLDYLYTIAYPVGLMMEFLSLTGLRFGELAALRECDFNEKDGTIDINGSLSVISSVGRVRGTPKNIHSYRVVSLCKKSVEIIRYFIRIKRRYMMEGKKGFDLSNPYIFLSEKGNPYEVHYVNRILRKVPLKGKKLSTHIFRHTHISILCALNIPLRTIMERVGHNEPRTTLSIYSHANKESKKDMMDKINSLSETISAAGR